MAEEKAGFYVHSNVHQPNDSLRPGLSLDNYGQYFNRHETWANEAKPWIDYLSRSCHLLRQGHNVADLLYYYGEDLNATARFDEDYPLLPKGYAFDYAGPGVLRDVRIEGDRIVTTSGMRYAAIILDNEIQAMSMEILQKIAAMAEAGVIIIGNAPLKRADSRGTDKEFRQLTGRIWNNGHARVFPFDRIKEALSALPPDVDIRCDSTADLRFVHRQTVTFTGLPTSSPKAALPTFPIPSIGRKTLCSPPDYLVPSGCYCNISNSK